MRQDIRIAGLASTWTESYAHTYCKKLIEMGFCAKPVDTYVAYSHRSFTRLEAEEVLHNAQKTND